MGCCLLAFNYLFVSSHEFAISLKFYLRLCDMTSLYVSHIYLSEEREREREGGGGGRERERERWRKGGGRKEGVRERG